MRWGKKGGHSFCVEDTLNRFHMESFEFYRIACPIISINKKMDEINMLPITITFNLLLPVLFPALLPVSKAAKNITIS